MSDAPVEAAIALGSNLGDRRVTLRSALAELARHEAIEVLAVSTIVETAPLGEPGQGPYLNAAALVATTLGPRALLDVCQAIEVAHGRIRERRQRWGPRTLDLDLLLYGHSVIDEPGLVIPHPRLHERRFVLEPLAEIAGDRLHPRLDVRIADLLASIQADRVTETVE